MEVPRGRGFGLDFQGSWYVDTWLELGKSKGTTKTFLDPFQKQLLVGQAAEETQGRFLVRQFGFVQ